MFTIPNSLKQISFHSFREIHLPPVSLRYGIHIEARDVNAECSITRAITRTRGL